MYVFSLCAIRVLYKELMHEQCTRNDYNCRDFALLESAISSPLQTFGGRELYPTLFEKAAQLFHSLISNHCFLDGNKRIALHAMCVFLAINGMVINTTQDRLYELAMSTANGEMTQKDVVKWLKATPFLKGTFNIDMTGSCAEEYHLYDDDDEED